MECGITTDNSDDGGHIPPHQPTTEIFEQDEQNEEVESEQSKEEELVVAVGNSAKAARRVGFRRIGSEKGKPETSNVNEDDVQQQEQQSGAGQCLNTFISKVGLCLEETWNWLHYFLVTVIFLNLVQFANRQKSILGEEVEGVIIKEASVCLEVEENGNNSALLENSPNACSIQNEEKVEEAEEAIKVVGMVKAETCDRSSEEVSAVITSSTGIPAENTGEKIAQKIVSQVESLFSDENLDKDGFLLKHVRRRWDGFVSLKLVAGLRKVKRISGEFEVVLDALKHSSKLEMNQDRTKVRRVEPLPSFLRFKVRKDSSSNEENQQPIHQNNNKYPYKSGNNENGNKQLVWNRRNSSNGNPCNSSQRNSYCQGANNSHHRHSSFSKSGNPQLSQQQQLPPPRFRNGNKSGRSSSGEESGRRDSLPISALATNKTLVNGTRPKSTGYSEDACSTKTSSWLQRRKESVSKGELTFNVVLRQPKGPDGTNGFATGKNTVTLQQRLQAVQ